jgi:acetate kinase
MTIIIQIDTFRYILNELISDLNFKEINRKEDILIAYYRIVYSSDFDQPKVISSNTYSQLEALIDLVLLYNLLVLKII